MPTYSILQIIIHGVTVGMNIILIEGEWMLCMFRAMCTCGGV